MRLIDYLETRDDIDPRRIGLMGFSKGGIETYLAAAADPRVAVAVSLWAAWSIQTGCRRPTSVGRRYKEPSAACDSQD